MFTSLAGAPDVRVTIEFDVAAGQCGQLGQSQAGLDGQGQQGTVASALPPVRVGGGEHGLDLVGFEE